MRHQVGLLTPAASSSRGKRARPSHAVGSGFDKRRSSARWGLAAAVFFGVGALGCAENESSLFVRAVLDINEAECVADPDPESPILLFGVWDRSFESGYIAPLLVGNQMAPQGNFDKIRTETDAVTIRGAEVRRTTSEGVESEFSVPATGFIDAAIGEQEPGYGVAAATLGVPDDDFGTAEYIIVNVKVFGETLGGRAIESNELTFPIELCDGCLIFLPQGATVDPTTGACVGGEDAEIPCKPGQDRGFPCTAL